MLKRILSMLTLTAVILVATPGLAADYLGNTRSMKFHRYSCSTIKHHDAPHFVAFNTRDEAIAAGYVPCKRCNP
ncbi:MAG: nuclease [Selenomonadaceae bacterium]|nr:nuclease [Selenomonadaceae bacterium]